MWYKIVILQVIEKYCTLWKDDSTTGGNSQENKFANKTVSNAWYVLLLIIYILKWIYVN